MNCSSLEERIARYLDDALDRGEAHEIEEHLRACGACAEFADRLEGDRMALRTPPVDMSDVDFAAMRGRIRHGIAEEGRKGLAPALLIAASILLALRMATMWQVSHRGVPAIPPQVATNSVRVLPMEPSQGIVGHALPKWRVDPLVRDRRRRRSLCLESAFDCAAKSGTRGSRADQGGHPPTPQPDPALEAALREFLAAGATPPVSSSPASPVEIRIVTGDPNVVLILLQQSSGASMNKCAAILIFFAFGQFAQAQTKLDDNISPGLRIYEPKYLTPDRAAQVGRFVESAVEGVRIGWERVVNGLVLRTSGGAENLDRAEVLIKRFDVPQPAPPAERPIEMTVHLIRAWTDANRPQVALPPELSSVVKEMKGALPYVGFSLVDTIQSIVHDGLTLQDAMPNNSPGGYYFYNLSFNGLQPSEDRKSVKLGTFHFGVKVPVPSTSGTIYQDESITTPLTIQEGQKLVLGKIKLHNDDLFVVLSYKLT